MPYVNVATTNETRLAKRLINHFHHKAQVIESDTDIWSMIGRHGHHHKR
ncbi:MAG: hypothetical protein Q3971_04735 [Moraxella sp.]|nr:hypothetical protein [Moraxella sp.]